MSLGKAHDISDSGALLLLQGAWAVQGRSTVQRSGSWLMSSGCQRQGVTRSRVCTAMELDVHGRVGPRAGARSDHCYTDLPLWRGCQLCHGGWDARGCWCGGRWCSGTDRVTTRTSAGAKAVVDNGSIKMVVNKEGLCWKVQRGRTRGRAERFCSLRLCDVLVQVHKGLGGVDLLPGGCEVARGGAVV